MCRKPVLLFALALTLTIVSSVPAELVVHWKLDETSGTTAFDSSGNSFNGALAGSPTWVIGKVDGALEFHSGGECVQYNFSEKTWDACTVALWVKMTTVGQAAYRSIFSNHSPNTAGFQIDLDGGNPGNYRVHPGAMLFGTVTTDWVYLTLTSVGTSAKLYYNGSFVRSGTLTDMLFNKFALAVARSASGYSACTVDDLRVYDNALTDAEIQSAMMGSDVISQIAYKPTPANGAVLDVAWVNLSWKPGGQAASHNVYLGENFEDVNAGAGDTFRGNYPTPELLIGFPGFPYPEGLVPGTTYYWRVDEVNNGNPNSPWRGDVWNFTIPSKIAYGVFPADGAMYVPTDVVLTWKAGQGARLHYVYFGDNPTDVNAPTGGTPTMSTSYTPPGPLAYDKTYYWRVDEFDGVTTHRGALLSFRTIRQISIADPNLVAWWTFDEGAGTTCVDWSGHANHGTLVDSKWSTPGFFGDASLDFTDGGYVAIQNLSYSTTGNTQISVSAWIRTDSDASQYIVSFDRNEYYRLEIDGDGAGPGQVGWDLMTSTGQVDYGSLTRVDDNRWHHVCGTFDNGWLTLYIDGVPEPSVMGGPTFGSGNMRFGFLGANSEASSFNGTRGAGLPISGNMDDVRIYNKALTQEQIGLIMRYDPLLAWGAKPAEGATLDIEHVTPLTWSRGDKAVQHEVYFGLDGDAVANANASDTTGAYRGRQNATSYTPAEGLAWGGGPYFWRVDENNNDATITKGRIWSFAVADYLIVDDIESYNDLAETDAGSNRIYTKWIDGYGTTTNGALVGNLDVPLTEHANVHSGSQAMPLSYDNNLKFSEATLTLTAGKDWTRQGVTDLSLWFRGDAANAVERMYVALNGTATVYHSEPNAVQTAAWTEWDIPLQAFASQGVNLRNVTSITIGFGTRGNTTAAGGTGQMYFDDIRLYRTRVTP